MRWILPTLVLLIGCGGSTPPPSEPLTSVPSSEPTPSSGRASLDAEQCERQGGKVVGDIGDGATQRPDYVCPNGGKPFGNIAPPSGGPIAVEGSVCCPK